MKLMKKVLSIFLTMLLLLSASVMTLAATITHTISASEQTEIKAVEYTTAKSVYKIGSIEYTADGAINQVDGRLVLDKSKTVSTVERSLTNTVTYTINVEKAGYYRFQMSGMYKTTAPTVYVSVDGGQELESKKLQSRDTTVNLGYIDIAAGPHTVTFKFIGGDASIENIYLKNMQKDVGRGTTLIPIVDYISTNITDTRSYSANGISPCIPVSSAESENLGSGLGLNTKYRINVTEAGQYKVIAYSCRVRSNIYADVSIVGTDGRSIIARRIAEPTLAKNVSGITISGIETSSFNLSSGVQDLHLRLHSVNTDPINEEDNHLFVYYIELEKVDSIQNAVEISADSKTEIEPESVFYTDEGVTKEVDSATISADKTAHFRVNVPSEGNYAFSIKYKAEADTYVKVNTLTTDIYKDMLIPSNDEFLTYTLGISKLSAGENRIAIKPDKALEIEKIYINKVSAVSPLTAINEATDEAGLEAAIASAESTLDVELTDAMGGIFYKKPVYNRLLKKDYSSIGEFVKEYNKSLLSEYNQPWVTLYVDNVKKTELATGYIKLTASTGYVPKGSTMIAVLYENLNDGIKTMYRHAICEQVSQNTYDFIFDTTEINPEKSYTLEFFYWDGLEKVSPIDVFDSVYEEIYVSATGNDSTGNGTEENPYKTMQKALDKVAEINDYQWGDIIVNVAGGTYTITETLVIDEKYSGKNGYNVIIRGEEDNQPEINGGIRVTNWTQHENGIWKAPISGIEHVRNLYVNGYPGVIARSDRHYNTGISKTDASEISTTIYTVGSTEDKVETQNVTMTQASTGLDQSVVNKLGFSMSLEDLDIDFSKPVGMEFVWPYTFEHHITPITEVNKTATDITFYMNYGLLQQKEGSAFRTGSSFYLQNAYELINQPGEFYYDADADYIYYYPYPYEDMREAETYIGNVEGMVKVAGSSLDSKASNITFENLAFRYGANNFISKYGYIGTQTDGVLVPFDWSEGNIAYMAQFAVDNADNINIEGCEFSCLGSAAISMIDSVSNSSINGNIIRDISGTGIRIGHPIHNRERAGVEVCQNIDITNNVIRRIAGEMLNNSAITVYYEKFINILHNDIDSVPYTGVSVGWGWSGGAAYDHSDIDISYNKIQNVMNSLHDGGGIYTLGAIKNCKISNNYLNGHKSRSGGMLYNDNGSALIEVFNNVVLNSIVCQAITRSNTKDLTYYNNYSDTGTHSDIEAGKNISWEDHLTVTGEGATLNKSQAREIYFNAGLESNYASLLSKEGVELPEAGRTISSTLPKNALSDSTTLYSTDYDKSTSSSNLEMTTYADGIGVAITQDQKINFKLDIPESGYYSIYLSAMGDGTTLYGSQHEVNGIEVSGDGTDVNMFVYGSQNPNDYQLSIANEDKFTNYRICTAYFTKGENDLTFKVNKSTDKVIIKALSYSNLKQTVKSSGVNIIKIKNYYDATGIFTNGYENNQSGYTSEGADYYVVGAVTNGGNKTTTLTYKLNVEEAGTYKVTAASWVGENSPATYQISIGGVVKSEATTKTYNRLHKSEDTQMPNLQLPQGEVELQFKVTTNGSNHTYMYYFTLEKTN